MEAASFPEKLVSAYKFHVAPTHRTNMDSLTVLRTEISHRMRRIKTAHEGKKRTGRKTRIK
jgi:hypothetical protein